MRRLPFAALVLLVALTGCTAEPEPIAPGTNPALALVNLWRVTGAEGVTGDTYLRLDARELTVWTDCGIGSGSWRSDGEVLLVDVYGSSPGVDCLPATDGTPQPSLEWLSAARSFRVDGDSISLVDSSGDQVAQLTIDGAPASSPNLLDSYLEAPVITAETRREFEIPVSLPDGVIPADDVIGRWVPKQTSELGPYVKLSDDGQWEAFDGCNSSTGHWALGSKGAFLTTGGVTTLMACDNWSGAGWIEQAARVGVRDGNILFYDADATLLGSVKPA